MRFSRAIIIPALLAFGAAGSVLAAAAVPAAAAQAPAAHAQSHASSMRPLLHYHA